MANLLGFAAAGALAGAGAGLHEDAVARRNAVMQELRDRRNQAFQTSEREARQRFDEGQSEKTRTFQAGESEKTRSHQSSMEGTRHGNQLDLEKQRDANERGRIGFRAGLEYGNQFSDQDNNAWVRDGLGNAKPVIDPATGKQLSVKPTPEPLYQVKGPDGQPTWVPRSQAIGQVPGSTPDPNGISTADQRIINMAEDANKRGTRINRDGVISNLAAQGRRDLAERYAGEPVGADGLTQSAAQKQAKMEADKRDRPIIGEGFKDAGGSREDWERRRVDELMGRNQKPQSAQPASQPAPAQSQSSAPPAQPAAASAPQKYPAAPRDPAQRTVGQVYQAPNGKLGEWTSNGWRMISP